ATLWNASHGPTVYAFFVTTCNNIILNVMEAARRTLGHARAQGIQRYTSPRLEIACTIISGSTSMSNASNQTSTDGIDNPFSIGYGTVGRARDAAKPPDQGGGFGVEANHGFGVLGVAGNGSDTKFLVDSLPLPTGPLNAPEAGDPQQNILKLRGRLPEAG